jgi:hypothetical protein
MSWSCGAIENGKASPLKPTDYSFTGGIHSLITLHSILNHAKRSSNNQYIHDSYTQSGVEDQKAMVYYGVELAAGAA